MTLPGLDNVLQRTRLATSPLRIRIDSIPFCTRNRTSYFRGPSYNYLKWPQGPHPSLPSTYRVVFTIIDPFFCVLGVATHLLTKNDVVAGLSPSALVPPAPETALLLDFLLGFFAMLGCLQVSLLRARPNDVAVWRALQGSTLVLDIIMTAATARKLVLEGRTDPAAWLGGEWQNLAGNAAIGAIRAAFVLGIGMGGAKEKTA